MEDPALLVPLRDLMNISPVSMYLAAAYHIRDATAILEIVVDHLRIPGSAGTRIWTIQRCSAINPNTSLASCSQF